MNRIILIGNGFDLAHGLKTSYGDFIDWLWMSFGREIAGLDNEKTHYNNSFIQVSNLPSLKLRFEDCSNYEKFMEELESYRSTLLFNNKFFQIINHYNMKGWVDVEGEFYDLLKNILDLRFNMNPQGKLKIKNDVYQLQRYNIDTLQNDFNSVKKSLIKYLHNEQKIITPTFQEINKHLISPIKKKEISHKIISEYKIEKNKQELQHKTDRYKTLVNGLIEEGLYENSKNKLNSALLCNFNYTNTTDKYLGENIAINHIHGDLKNIKNNPIIFGFGDEIDENHKQIENINDNRYLENIKSIEYLQTDNYKKLLDYVESDKYQIFIMGHSCGLSDRTLLNTLFEHENCVSIKPFYYKYGEGDTDDNYKDIVQNISRNFKDKVKMREIVVNKEYCEPLITFVP